MTSSSSLYGTPPNQDVSSTNSTSLYGGADTPIPDSSGNVVVRGDLLVLSGNILTTATTGNIFPANATTINFGTAATSLNIGANTGTTTINNNLSVDGTGTFAGDITATGGDFGNITIAVADNQTITTTSGELRLGSATTDIKLAGVDTLYTDQSTFQLLNSPTTVTAFNGATSLTMGAATGTTTIRNDLTVQGNVTADGGDFGNVTVGLTFDNTIDTTTGDLFLSSDSGSIGLISVDTLYSDQASFQLLTSPTTVGAFTSATSLVIGATTGVSTIRNDLTIEGNDLNLAQSTSINYSENNDRANRPEVKSTTGNSSGWRVLAPNSTTSANANLTVFGSDDITNGEFLSLQASGSTTAPFAIRTGKWTGGVLGASGEEINFIDNVTTYASINPAGPTNSTDLTTKNYVDAIVGTIPAYDTNVAPATGGVDLQLREIDLPSIIVVGSTRFLGGTNVTIAETSPNVITISAPDLNTTYDFNASSTTGGANLNLVGSDSTTDTVKLTNGGGITATYTSGTAVTLGSNATPTNTVSTIMSRDINGDFAANVGAFASGTLGQVIIGGSTNGRIEIGQFNRATAGTPFVDFHSSASAADYDVRLIASGGGGGDGLGTLDVVAATTEFSGDITLKDTLTLQGSTSGSVALAAPATAGSQAYTLPTALPGVSGYVLSADTSGVMSWVANPDTNTTYDFNATSTTGGANLNLVGSDSTTDTVKLTNGGGITATYTSGTEVTLGSTATSANTASAIVARDGSGNFAASGATLGNVTVGVDTDQTISTTSGNLVLQTAAGVSAGTITLAAGTNGAITFAPNGTGTVVIPTADITTLEVTDIKALDGTAAASIANTTGAVSITTQLTVDNININGNTLSSTNTNGNIILAPNGSGVVSSGVTQLATASRTLGQHYGTQSTTWTPPASGLTNLTSQNGFFTSSSSGGANGASSVIQSRYYSGDTTAGTNISASLLGGGATGTNAAPAALANGQVLLSLNGDGYATTGWASTIATGTQTPTGIPIMPAQLQFYSREVFADNGTNVTAGGTGMRVRLFNAATTLSAANRVTVVDHTTTTATYKAATFNIQPAASTNNYAVFAATTGSINQDTFTLKNNAATTTYATFNSTSASLNGDTVNLNNTAGTSTWASFATGGASITTGGPLTLSRTSAVAATPAGQIIRLSRTDQTGPQNNDGIDFRLSVGGTSTTANFARFDGVYKSSGLNEIGMSVSTDSFAADTDRIYIGTRENTKIQTTPAGGGTVGTTAEFTQLATTLQSDALNLKTAAGVNLVGNKITYNRVYGSFQYNTTVTPVAANTAYVFPIGTVDFSNIVTVGSTSRIILGAAGLYNLQFSIQVDNSSNQEHVAYIWIRKNGVDVTASMGRITVIKSGSLIAGWNYVIDSANTTDYYELAYAVSNTAVTFPAFAATAFGPSTAALITTVTPVGA